jgi:hypothetical protein
MNPQLPHAHSNLSQIPDFFQEMECIICAKFRNCRFLRNYHFERKSVGQNDGCAAAMGVMQVLKAEHIAVDMVVGCSGGSVFGATIALGFFYEETMELHAQARSSVVGRRRLLNEMHRIEKFSVLKPLSESTTNSLVNKFPKFKLGVVVQFLKQRECQN